MDMAVLMDQRAVLGGPAGVVPDVDAERRAAGPDIDVGERVALAVREQAETGDRGEAVRRNDGREPVPDLPELLFRADRQCIFMLRAGELQVVVHSVCDIIRTAPVRDGDVRLLIDVDVAGQRVKVPVTELLAFLYGGAVRMIHRLLPVDVGP